MNANHPFKQLFHEPNFVKLWISQGLSQLTINLVNFSILTRVFETTKSSLAVSFLWLAYSLPALLFAPFSGSIVDRFSRRKMMILTNFLQALVIGSYLFVSSSHVTVLYILVFLYSFLDQIYLPAQQASVPSLVDKKMLSAANGLFLLTQQASFIVGFGLGGIFLSIFGRNNTTILSTLFLLVATVAVFLLPRDKMNRSEKTLGFKTGLEFVRQNPAVLFPLLTIVLTQVFITVITILLPSYTHVVLGLNLNHSSLTFVIPGGLGALATTYYLPKLLKTKRKKEVIEMGLLLAALSLITLALLPWLGGIKIVVAILVAITIGGSLASILVPTQTLLQEKTPSWFRGRVYGSLNFLLITATPIPLLLFSAIADALGVATMIGIIGGLLIVCLIFFKRKGDYVLANGIGV